MQVLPGSTPKAIEERIAKLKREAKASDGKAIVRTGAKTGPKTAPRKRAWDDLYSSCPGSSSSAAVRNRKRNPTFSLVLPNNFACGGELQDDEEDLSPTDFFKNEPEADADDGAGEDEADAGDEGDDFDEAEAEDEGFIDKHAKAEGPYADVP